ncbi:serine/threonine-protein kinase [Actinokineospora inagensis]|uniref:serine/threonine-protein kinase n=1 Tax=Actinokineospora inagensis TaxID=103730 RepID=UPI00047E9F6C|nr:serine/threonine-protein kinase [Actinokineospora inagensis]
MTLPPFAVLDPADAVLNDLRVPYRDRVCLTCNQLVGQPLDDQPGLDVGYCPRDGTHYSFVPALTRGSRVEQRYEVLGCLAYGGFGWIYLARDTHLADRNTEHWVVLKGLINSHDQAAVEAAAWEKRYLVEVDHPNVVKISDFAKHLDPRTGLVAGYIVMEYLPGRTLYDVLQRNRNDDGDPAPLPVPIVLRYADDLLAALSYLHQHNLVYCDLKPDNAMQVGQQVKLIDLGGVMRVGSDTASFHSDGFTAAEVRDGQRPDVRSDLYTLGRTMAVLSFPFATFAGANIYDLPEELPFDGPYESFGRLLRRAAHPDPALRFAAATDMHHQVLGVLAEVLAHEQKEPRTTTSTLFTRERKVFGTGAGAVLVSTVPSIDWSEVPGGLPSPLGDPGDPAAGFLATLGAVAPDRLVGALLGAGERSPELLLRLADAYLAARQIDEARNSIAEFTAARPGDWRTDWYLGLIALARNVDEDAIQSFEAVHSALPGELAPKLALAAALELDHDDIDRARDLYERVWNTDRSYVSAAFGVARTLRIGGYHDLAVEVLDEVPESSAHHTAAQVAALRAEVADPRTLPKAIERLGWLPLDAERGTRLDIEVHTAALAAVRDGAEETRLRVRLEKSYRALATLTGDRSLRSRLVDQANQVRPRTLV